MRDDVAAYCKSSLELFEAFVKINFDPILEIQTTYIIFKGLKRSNSIVIEAFSVFRQI